MILKGSTIASVKHARQFARHLFKQENTTVEIWQSFGAETKDELENDLVDMHLFTNLTRGQTGIFHVAIDPRQEESMTPENWAQAVAMIENEFALDGQLRIEVYHEKEGRPHLHVFWSLVDQEEEKLIQLRYYKRRLQGRADQMEREFGHAPTRRRANRQTIEITDADRMRKARTGRDPKERKELISRIWAESEAPAELIERLAAQGYQVAQGERCRYALVDREGETYNLVRQLPKLVRQKNVQERLAESYQQLPTVEQLRADLKERGSVLSTYYNQKIERQLDRIREKRKLSRGRTL